MIEENKTTTPGVMNSLYEVICFIKYHCNLYLTNNDQELYKIKSMTNEKCMHM